MRIVKTVTEVRNQVAAWRKNCVSVGFVPTMGYLHDGHLRLMRQAKAEQGAVVASIFVNPLQFGQGEDFAVYPRDLARDSQLATGAGVDLLFAPEVEEMYPDGYEHMKTFVEVQGLTEPLCGRSRPTHFRGVTTVVSKLLNIVAPDVAYFGQKDAQQVLVIQKMVRDLNMSSRIAVVPIVREPDGLAMSSRNVFLSPEERQGALALHRSLLLAQQLLEGGERDAQLIRERIGALIQQEPLATIDYVSVSDQRTLEESTVISGPILVALAVRFGRTRLIDNLMWGGE